MARARKKRGSESSGAAGRAERKGHRREDTNRDVRSRGGAGRETAAGRDGGRDVLDAYRKKRDFAKTPEPAAGSAAVASAVEAQRRGGALSFVIHRHEASHLHYDLRLELDGVLKSWAVPRGFSWNPSDKHLAVRTEDHPIEYLHFDGVIPKGEYGAGTMTIWDVGTYREVGAGTAEGMAEGKLELEFDGSRLRGQWHMVKTRGERDWLMFKFRDRYARDAGQPLFPLELGALSRSEPPARPGPMLAGSDTPPPLSSPDWIYELDFAGKRTLVTLDGDGVRFDDRRGRRIMSAFPEIADDLAGLRAARAVLDGVLVAAGEDERPDRAVLDARLERGETDSIVLYVFDLLHWDDWDLRGFPLRDRKSALASILPSSARVHYVDHVAQRGDELLAVVEAGGLPGLVAKRLDARYEAGPSAAWGRIGARAGATREASLRESLDVAASRRRSRVKFTNRDKVFWPKEGITKGQLLDYYEGVADVILPYLRDRPCHMLRYPDGIEGKSFYQKNVTGRIPDWVPTQLVKVEGGEEVRYVVCNDRDTLLFLVNLGSIDIHPWLSRCDAPDVPDLAVIDLDPSASDFSKVVRIAQTVGKVLRGAGLRPCVKTSGASGLHIYLPLAREYDYEQARMFCELVARLVVREHKDIATVERTPAKRGDKVYVDFLQNRREQTLVPPYVVRPQPGATVSTPLDWDEVRSGLHPSQFHLANVPERVGLKGDLFRGVLDDPQRLEDAIAALASR
jgi:bifunctional non-homologous end joining protein LigD